MNKIDEILQYFPIDLYNSITNAIKVNKLYEDQVQEIRLRVSKPVILKFRNFDITLEYIVTTENILQILERFCENSIYAYKNQICQGFLTIKGGHRVGITGTVVMENGKIINVKYVSSLNIRVAREVPNCSNEILNKIIDKEGKTIFNTLIVSPPGKGKTTVLRDLVKQISNMGLTVGLVDERGEIAATYKGIPQNDVGIRTDVIGNIDKTTGIEMLIRSMAPNVIACDEIGGESDIHAIKKAMISGVKGIFTMHGKDIEDVNQNAEVHELVENKQIERIIFI